jgi:hypothetical protein
VSDEIKHGINRKLEDSLVLKYQETGDDNILSEIYERRAHTFRFLSLKYYYVCEDITTEIKTVFMKAVKKYQTGKKSFNTYFYTAFINHVRNLLKGKTRKKRTTPETDQNPESVFVRMDDSVDGATDGVTYHDVIPDVKLDWTSNVDYIAVSNFLNSKSWILADFFFDMMNGTCTISRRREYSNSVLLSGRSPQQAIAADVGLPRDAYSVVGFNCDGRHVTYCVTVSSKKCVELAREYASSIVTV